MTEQMHTTTRTRPAGRLAVLALAAALAAALLAPAGGPTATALVDVIVRGTTGVAQARAAVVGVGGHVTHDLAVVSGVAATVPADQLDDLQAAGLAVTPDGEVEVLGAKHDREQSPEQRAIRSVRTAIEVIDADRLWDRGITGAGVGVALIDTGVAPVAGLDAEGKLWHGPDLSFESINEATRHLDTFGHGTHMAGLIAGRDAGVTPATAEDHPDAFLGVAPDAHLISVKVADHTGMTDVSQVLAAIDWVVANADDPRLNIRVLNLSFGTYSDQAYLVDPLAHAAEVAWDRGIVVVAAAGNDGDERVGLTSPAYSPRVLAVGAVDTNDSRQTAHWRPLGFSARGDGRRNPDVLAPGSSLAGLRVPGSFLDERFGGQAVVAERFFKGTGTSQAAALVSGAAALVLSEHPTWTPDMVKDAILAKSRGLPRGHGFTAQTGNRALQLNGIPSYDADDAWQTAAPSTGDGTVEAARGDAHVVLDGVELVGELDIFGNPIDAAALADARDAGTAWQQGTWNGTQWSGTQWSGTQWSGTQWSGDTWTGTQWSGTQWSGTQWSGTQWSGSQWSGTQWSGSQWSGGQWSGSQWSGIRWLGGTWR